MDLVQAPEYWAGGHGLHSTPRDYMRFERALLGGGELDGVRILDEATPGPPRAPVARRGGSDGRLARRSRAPRRMLLCQR